MVTSACFWVAVLPTDHNFSTSDASCCGLLSAHGKPFSGYAGKQVAAHVYAACSCKSGYLQLHATCVKRLAAMTLFVLACNLCASVGSNQRPLQDAKMLLLGDARAFFTMYKAIVDVGLKPFQLDRDERLLKAGLPAEELKQAAGEAATAADCILVTHQQLVSPGFPFERYALYVLKGFA